MNRGTLLLSLAAITMSLAGIILLRTPPYDGLIGNNNKSQAADEVELIERPLNSSLNTNTISDVDLPKKNDSLLLHQPEIREYFSNIEFEQKINDYFENYQNFSDDEKTDKSKLILETLNMLESDSSLLPIEALNLKLALFKTTTSESDYSKLARNLTAEYQEKFSSEKPEIDYDKNAQYKEQEREVVLEIQVMSQYPDGMSQSEYLRHRLQILRAEIFESDTKP